MRAKKSKIPSLTPERRATADRRTNGDDRRVFPRPEGRRKSGGRRAGDPRDA